MSAPSILEYWPEGIAAARIPANNNVRLLQALLLNPAISATTSAQPASPAEGDVYILPAAPSGAMWSGFFEDDVVIFYNATWTAYTPAEGLRKFVEDEGEDWQFVGDSSGGWAPAGGGGGGAVSSVNGLTGSVVLALDDLDDVDAASPTTNDVLTWDGTDWVNQAPSGGAAVITVDGTPGIDELVLGTNLSGSAAGSVFTINAPGGGGGSSVVVDLYFASGPVPSDTGVFENPSSSNRLARGRIPRSSGKYCFAVNVVNYGNGANFSVGVMQVNCTDIQLGNTGSPSASKTSSWGLIQSGGAFTGFNGGVSGSGPVPSAPDVIVVYVDFAVGIWWEINGTVMGGGDPAAGTSPTFSNMAGPVLPGGSLVESGGTAGQMEFDLTSTSPFGATIRAGYTMWGI